MLPEVCECGHKKKAHGFKEDEQVVHAYFTRHCRYCWCVTFIPKGPVK